MANILLIFEGSSWSPDLSQVTAHLLMHCLEKPHKLFDPQVSPSFYFWRMLLLSILLVINYHILVKQIYSQNLWRWHNISLINRTATKLRAQQINRASQVWMYAKFSSTRQVKELPMFFSCLFLFVPVGHLFFLSSKKQETGFMWFL